VASVLTFAASDWHIATEKLLSKNVRTQQQDLTVQVDAVVQYAKQLKEKNADRVLIFVHCGDVFDTNKPTPEQIRFAEELFAKLLTAFDEVHLVLGNHDNNDTDSDALVTLEGDLHTGKLHVYRDVTFERLAGRVPVVFIPHLSKKILLPTAKQTYDEAVSAYLVKKGLVGKHPLGWESIVFGHGLRPNSIAGSEKRLISGGVMALPDVSCKLMVLGHVHLPQQPDDHTYYVGSSTKVDFSERDEEKRYLVIQDDAQKVKSVALDAQRYVQIEVDGTVKNPVLPKEEEYAGAVVKLVVSTTSSRRHQIPMFDLIEKVNKVAFVRQHKIDVVDDPVEERQEAEKETMEQASPSVAVKSWLKLQKDPTKEVKKATYEECQTCLAEVSPKESFVVATGRIRLERLCVKNCGGIAEADVILPEGVCGILGRHKSNPAKSNGSGKSDLIEAAYYALSGRSTRGTIAELANDVTLEPLEVTLCLFVGDTKITVTRGHTVYNEDGSLRKTTNPVATLTVGDDKTPKAVGNDEVTATIESLLGVGVDTLLQTSFFLESFQEGFLRAKPLERKEYLQQFFALQIYDKAQKVAKDRRKEVNAELERRQGSIKALEEQGGQADLPKLKAEELRLHTEIEDSEKLVQSLREQRDKKSEEGHLRKQLKEAKLQLGSAEADRTEALRIVKDAKERVVAATAAQEKLVGLKATFEECQNKYREAQRGLDNVVTERKQVVARIRELTELGSSASCSMCEQQIPHGHTEKLLEAAQARLLKVDNTHVKAESSLKEHNDNLRAAREEVQLWEPKAARLDGAKEAVSRQRAVAEAAEERRDKVGKLVAKIEEKLAGSSPVGLEIIEVKLSEAESSLSGLQVELGSVQTRKEDCAKRLESLKALRKEAKGFESRLEVLELTVSALDKNGAVSLLIAQLLRQVEARTNEVLEQLTEDDPMVVEWENFATTQKSVREGVELWLRWQNGGKRRRYATYSGGERSLVNFAVRAGLAFTLAAMSKFNASFLMLDEVMGKLDEVNTAAMVRVLNYVQKQFAQVLMVTHNLLKDSLPASIMVERNDQRVSYISIGG